MADTYNAALKKLGDENPSFIDAVTDLTASRCKEIWDITSKYDFKGNGIYTQSVGSCMKKASGGAFPLNMSYHLVKHFDGKIYNGWDWASITHEFATYLTEKESLIKKMFKKTLCPSELWLHTLALNSPFKDRLFDVNSLRNGSMRYIDWQRGRPYTWGAEDTDFDTLMDSPYLFARKFDVKHRDIVLKLHNFLKQQD